VFRRGGELAKKRNARTFGGPDWSSLFGKDGQRCSTRGRDPVMKNADNRQGNQRVPVVKQNEMWKVSRKGWRRKRQEGSLWDAGERKGWAEKAELPL